MLLKIFKYAFIEKKKIKICVENWFSIKILNCRNERNKSKNKTMVKRLDFEKK